MKKTYYVDDGIVEFKDNCLSILTSNIFDIKKIDKKIVKDALLKQKKIYKKQIFLIKINIYLIKKLKF